MSLSQVIDIKFAWFHVSFYAQFIKVVNSFGYMRGVHVPIISLINLSLSSLYSSITGLPSRNRSRIEIYISFTSCHSDIWGLLSHLPFNIYIEHETEM